MKAMFKRLRKSKSGQGMTEYIIIVALIAIAAIGVVTVFGENIRALFGTATNSLAGEKDAQIEGTKVDEDEHIRDKSLENFAP